MPHITIALVVLAALFTGSCPGLSPPVAGEIVRPFAPEGRYAGHWGVDFAADPGTPVSAGDAGIVTFAGEVAGVLSVTVDHGGGLRTSYSYLGEIAVKRGDRLDRGDPVGSSGTDHDVAAVHFSVRIGDVYQNPGDWLRCLGSPHRGLSLIPVPTAYASPRATRHTRRYLRSTSSRSPVCGRGRISRPGAGRRHVSPGGRTVAEGGA